MLTRLFTIFAALSFGLPVNAQDAPTDNTWNAYPFRIVIMNTPKPKAKHEHKFRGEAISTTSDKKQGVQFFCVNKQLRVNLTTKPANIRSAMAQVNRTGKALYVDFSLDEGKRKPLGKWVYENNTSLIRAPKRSQAAKLYNATIRGQKVTMYVEGRKPFVLDLPPPNRDFNTFGAECGLGINANRDK